MKVQLIQSNDAAVLRIEGEMDIYSCRIFREHIGALAEKGLCKVIANMDLVSYIDSSGIGALISAFATLRWAGGGMKLCQPSQVIRRIIEMSRLTTFFEIYDTETEALEAFGVQGLAMAKKTPSSLV